MSETIPSNQHCTGFHGSQVECGELTALRAAFERRTTLLQLAFTAIRNDCDLPDNWIERVRVELYPTADDGYNGSTPLPSGPPSSQRCMRGLSETKGNADAGLSQGSVPSVASRLDGHSHGGGDVAHGAQACACGSTSLRVRRCLSGEQFVQVECQRCYRRGPIGARAPDAVIAWNRQSSEKTSGEPQS